MTPRAASVFALAALACSVGCIGHIGGEGPTGEDRGRPDPAIRDHHTAIGLRRLTRLEYGLTVRDLLGVDGAEEQISDAGAVDFLSNNAHVQRVGLADLEAYARAAEKASTEALSDLVLPDGCVLASMSSACVTELLEGFLLRAFRRPATDEELARYGALFELLVPDAGSQEALRSVVESVLLAPHFLYRSEVGDAEGRLGPYELASRLSYLLWSTMPDAQLFAAAGDGALDEADGLRVQIERMLDDPRAEVGTVRFVYEWLGLDGEQVSRKGADILQELPTTLQQQLEEETARFVIDVLLGPEPSLRTLLTADYTFANETVATLYGLSDVSGDDFHRVTLDARERRGILTQPLLIASHSKESGYSAVQMGRFVRERLLCQDVQPPPPGVDTTLAEADASLPFRERFEQHEANPGCAACHTFLDPPGFAYLPYDPIGRYRTADPAGNVFDTAGELSELDGDSVPFEDATSLIDALAESDAVYACFVRRHLQFAFGRTLAEQDLPLYHALADALVASNGDFVTYISQLVRSPEFASAGPQL
jgi:hypothetical protein